MNEVIELFKAWLAGVPTATGFAIRAGHWSTYDASKSNRYITFSVVGGPAPREVDTRQPQIMLTIVGSKRDELTTIYTLAENIMAATKLEPLQCGLVWVNAVGEVIGPMTTQEDRPLVTMTLQMTI